ncbi:hypothetical protein ABIC90_005408 [Variovorax boronicumulans]
MRAPDAPEGWAPVPEDRARLCALPAAAVRDPADLVAALRRDEVVLVQGISDQAHADLVLADATMALGLLERLKVQAGYASLHGHRTSVGRYFMTVNRRDDYHFIPPHSEGTPNADIQLGSLYCHHNTTDGGDNFLFNTDTASPAWSRLREVTTKVDLCGRQLGRRDAAMLKIVHGVSLPGDVLAPGSEILEELPAPLPGIRLYNVLAPVRPVRSRLLDRDVRVLWDNVATMDFDCAAEFMRLLQGTGLLRQPPGGADIAALDGAHARHVWRSGVRFDQLFRARITHRLLAGELLLFNNLTWAHSTSNWTPQSGSRQVVAAFA